MNTSVLCEAQELSRGTRSDKINAQEQEKHISGVGPIFALLGQVVAALGLSKATSAV
jgi:hypothetical protein